MNNKYKIKVGHPLVRPGLTIETEASERYVLDVTNKLMEIVRDLNRDNGSSVKTPVAWDEDKNPLYSVGDMPQ